MAVWDISQILREMQGILTSLMAQLPSSLTDVHVILSALFPIYIASHASLGRPASAAKPLKDSELDEDESEDEFRRMEGLSTTDALLFPIFAGATLTGLYLLLKWLQDPEILNRILNWYFTLIGLYGVCMFISDAFQSLHSFVFPTYYSIGPQVWKINRTLNQSEPLFTLHKSLAVKGSPLPGRFSTLPLPSRLYSGLWRLRELPRQKVTVRFYVARIVSVRTHLDLFRFLGIMLGSAAVLHFNVIGKPWYLTNLIGFSFSYSALQLMTPVTFKTGFLVLGGLFFYDIYMVFFTPMMVTVAKQLDVPIKLLFPRPLTEEEVTRKLGQGFSMLGLGDIVLPGLLVGLCLRFDLYQHYLRKQQGDEDSNQPIDSNQIKAHYISPSKHWFDDFWTDQSSSLKSQNPAKPLDFGMFPKTYFRASLVGYTVGMITTLVAMHYSNHPQPALLYLVPGVLLSILLTAWTKGDLKVLFSYDEAKEDSKDEQSTDYGSDNAINKRSVFSREQANSCAAASAGLVTRQVEDSESEQDPDELDSSTKRDSKKRPSERGRRPKSREQKLFVFSVSTRAHPRKCVTIGQNKSDAPSPAWIYASPRGEQGEPGGKRLRKA